jgi:hypothetical protein
MLEKIAKYSKVKKKQQRQIKYNGLVIGRKMSMQHHSKEDYYSAPAYGDHLYIDGSLNSGVIVPSYFGIQVNPCLPIVVSRLFPIVLPFTVSCILR